MKKIINNLGQKIDKSFSTLVALLMILSCGPFFVLGGRSTIINFLFFCFFILLYVLVIFKNERKKLWAINKSNYYNLIVSLIFFFILFAPFRQYDGLVAVSIWAVIFLLFLFLDDYYVELVGHTFSNIIFYVVLLSLVIWILLFLGFNLPSWEYKTGLVGINKSSFLVYPGTAVLNGQDFLLFGRNVFRVSGIFSEPGHFGIVCFFAYLMSSQLSKFKRNVIVFGSMFSFSLGTYALWLGYLFVSDHFTVKRKLKITAIIIFVLFLGFLYLPQEFLERFIISKLMSDSVLDNRTGENFLAFFQKEHGILQHIFGYGRLVFEEFDLSNSDYRGFYLRYGILGISAYFLWVIILNFNGWRKNNWLVFFVMLIILAHRAWLIDYFILYFIIYYMTRSEKL